MKKYVLIVFMAFIGINNITAQDLHDEQLKTSLNFYDSQCKLSVEHIEAIRNASDNLPDKTKESEKVANLVRQIINDINKIHEKTKSLNKKIKELSDSLQTSTSRATPKEGKHDMQEQPPVETPKETVEQPVEGVREYLLSFSLNDLCREGQEGLQKRGNDIKSKLKAYGDDELYRAYVTILELLNVQYIIYSSEVSDVLQRATEIEKDLLLGNHYNELQNEIAKAKEYRYATMELRRLIKILDNPSDAIKKELGYDNSGAGDSKWADAEDVEIPASKIRDYLIKKNETEYIFKFEYTKKKFEDSVNHPEKRKAILAEIDNALK